MLATAARITLTKALEDKRHDLRIDANTVVAHHDLSVRIDAPQIYLDPSPAGSELHRIRQQIGHHLLQAVRIAGHCGAGTIELRQKPNTLRLGSGTDYFDRAFQYRYQLDWPDLKSHAARDDARYIKQVGDHLVERLRVAQNRL